MAGVARDLVLAIDAALAAGGTVAVIRAGTVVAERETAMRGETSERLMPAIADALAEARATPCDLDRVVCGAGPGSFTSLRIAASLAKGLCVAARIPLFQVSSLALIVAGTRPAPAAGRYLAAIDALRGEHFTQLVEWNGSVVTGTGALTRHPSEALTVEAQRQAAVAIGPGMPLNALPHARGVAAMKALLATDSPVDLESWEPWYGRPAEAQARWEAAHGRPLSA